MFILDPPKINKKHKQKLKMSVKNAIIEKIVF